MSVNLSIITTICFIFLTNAQGDVDPNEYLDKVLEEVNKLTIEQGIEPYNAIDSKFFGVHITGELHGLSSWFRQGNAKRTENKASKIVEVDANIGLKNLTIDLNWALQLAFIPVTGQATSSVDSIVTNIRFRVNLDTNILIITKFKVTEVGKITTEVKAIPVPFMDKITGMVVSAVGNLAKNAIAKLVEGQVKNLVEDTLNHFLVLGIPF
uniref:Lipid-binding serum glycoprotein N-terminal domain-containing protein n=1 Tax=Strigamia maritima TaxID=126957 RepID=T1ISX5_STRMM